MPVILRWCRCLQANSQPSYIVCLSFLVRARLLIWSTFGPPTGSGRLVGRFLWPDEQHSLSDFGGHGPPEQVSLSEPAADSGEKFSLRLRLDAFGDDVQPQ